MAFFKRLHVLLACKEESFPVSVSTKDIIIHKFAQVKLDQPREMRQHKFSINATNVSLNLRRVLLSLSIVSLDDAWNVKDLIPINLIAVLLLLLRFDLTDFARFEIFRSLSLWRARLGLV